MFSFFGKKKKTGAVRDFVFLTSLARDGALAELLFADPSVIVVTWFEYRFEQLSPRAPSRVMLARETTSHHITGKKVVFSEHYPLASVEDAIKEKLDLREMVFYSALDEPLFQTFGGDRIISMVRQLGLAEYEALEHSFISPSIHKAQEKLARKVVVENTAHSQEEWFRKNLASG